MKMGEFVFKLALITSVFVLTGTKEETAIVSMNHEIVGSRKTHFLKNTFFIAAQYAKNSLLRIQKLISMLQSLFLLELRVFTNNFLIFSATQLRITSLHKRWQMSRN